MIINNIDGPLSQQSELCLHIHWKTGLYLQQQCTVFFFNHWSSDFCVVTPITCHLTPPVTFHQSPVTCRLSPKNHSIQLQLL